MKVLSVRKGWTCGGTRLGMGVGPLFESGAFGELAHRFCDSHRLTAVSPCFLYNSSIQHRLVLLTYDTLDSRVPAMMAAKRVKIALLSHDDVLFRYLATRDEDHLGELQSYESATRSEITTLSSLTTSAVIRARLDLLRSESEHYFAEHSSHPRIRQEIGPAERSRLFQCGLIAAQTEIPTQGIGPLVRGRPRAVNTAFCLVR